MSEIQKGRLEWISNDYTVEKGLICLGDKGKNDYNCAGGTLLPVVLSLPPESRAGLPNYGKKICGLTGPDAGKILQALYEPLPPGQAPQPGDACVFSEGGSPEDSNYGFGHIGTVVGDLDGRPLIYGKDGYYGSFVGTVEQWSKCHGGCPHYYRLKEHVRNALSLGRNGENHPVVEEYRWRAHHKNIPVHKLLRAFLNLKAHPDFQ
ncbi:MAG TPA: CHAP domain-containing protein [Candidatus Nitrosotenuis sp.]|nr:CHAP domain-containing protein [Candidatus Nitrosotenuis sp.]